MNPTHFCTLKKSIRIHRQLFNGRYKILCINLVKDEPKPEVVAQTILTQLQMPEENYRMGKTKVHIVLLWWTDEKQLKPKHSQNH